MKTEYQMICGADLEWLGKTVTLARENGWRIAGPLAVEKDVLGHWQYRQPMIREIEPKPESCKPSTPPATLQWKPIPEHFPGDGNRLEADCHLGKWVITHEPASEVFHLLKTRIRGISKAHQASMLFFDQQAAMKFCDDYTHNVSALSEAVR